VPRRPLAQEPSDPMRQCYQPFDRIGADLSPPVSTPEHSRTCSLAPLRPAALHVRLDRYCCPPPSPHSSTLPAPSLAAFRRLCRPHLPPRALPPRARCLRSEEAVDAFFRAVLPPASMTSSPATPPASARPRRSLSYPLAPTSCSLIPAAAARPRSCAAGSGGVGGLVGHHGATGAALRALHRQFSLRPAWGDRHRVRTHAYHTPLLLLVTTPFVVQKCLWKNADIFSRQATQSSSSIDGEKFNTSIHFVAVFPGI
jgi:hypothetical protein